jgi:predicted lipoprotein with Yx(FWY)xxD motif
MWRGTLMTGCFALAGCVGYSGGTGSVPEAGESPDAAPAPVEDDAGEPVSLEDAAPAPRHDAGTRDASSPRQDAAAPDADVLLGYAGEFEGYLMDRRGQPLYMLADDVAGVGMTTCLGSCAEQWPPFDVEEGVQAGPELIANEFTRFHRQDGDHQIAYKGHPLYFRASESEAQEVTGDGVEGRWFVARDYLAFVGRTRNFAPAGSTSFEALYLTNAFGRTLYVCFDDTQASASELPVTSCLGECALRRPIWSVVEAGRSSILPSIMPVDELGQFTRPDGAQQLTYRGWPLYYFTEDQSPGAIQGHNEEAWRALDPVNFGVEADAGAGP